VTIRLPFEQELQRASVYPGSKHPSTRRRLRSIPPMDPPANGAAPTPREEHE